MTTNNYTENALAYFIENDDDRKIEDYNCVCIHDWKDNLISSCDVKDFLVQYINWGQMAIDDSADIIIRVGDKYYTINDFADVTDWWNLKTDTERCDWLMTGLRNNDVFVITEDN
jgi:hypothetical protein